MSLSQTIARVWSQKRHLTNLSFTKLSVYLLYTNFKSFIDAGSIPERYATSQKA